MNKREFIRTLGGASLGLMVGDELWARAAATPPRRLAQDERFWRAIRAQYLLTPEYINLENGFYSMQSQPVLEAFIGRVREVNRLAARYMRTRQGQDKAAVRNRLAAMAGVPPEEMIITRNTTEAMDTIISGFPWREGDEALMAEQDFPAMLNQFRLVARRYGIVNRMVSLPMDPRSDDELVRLYESAITPRTRLLMLCHIINTSGHLLPVARIAEMAHRHGVQVIVDGAHAFALLDFAIPDLGCDYYAASLHKWLGCPLGAGILWLRREHIPNIWPMFASFSAPDDDIRKLNHTGTHPVHTDLAINDAIDFHDRIGTRRKEERLRFLQRYWTDQVRAHPGITMNTPSDPARSCAVANVAVAGIAPADLAGMLLERFRIYTAAVDAAGIRGVRVTPHLFTTTAELDTLVRALRTLAG